MIKIIAICLLTLITPLLAQQTIGPKWRVTWDQDGNDINGNPETLERFEISFQEEGQTEMALLMNVPIPPLQTFPGTMGINLESLQLADGIYNLTVRAIDQAGNESGWSDPPLLIKWDSTAPTTAGNITINISISIDL